MQIVSPWQSRTYGKRSKKTEVEKVTKVEKVEEAERPVRRTGDAVLYEGVGLKRAVVTQIAPGKSIRLSRDLLPVRPEGPSENSQGQTRRRRVSPLD